MDGLYDSISITGVARTVARVMGIGAPERSREAIGPVVLGADRAFGGRSAGRVFLYNPDAIALWLFQKYTALFEQALLRTQMQLPLLSVMPSVTPVCFASMYTGAMPQAHGIQAYEKPVLTTDTLFDAALRAGKRPAIISTAGDSMSVIFNRREMDYFIFDTVQACNDKALELIERDEHDLIALYNANYDAAMHRVGPEAPEAMEELRRNIADYCGLYDHISRRWAAHDTLMGFCPDHGCHLIDGGLGSHGLDMPQDMNVVHMYSFIAGDKGER